MRRIYSAVQMFFIALALAAIGSVISNIDSLSGLGSLLSLVGGVMTIVGTYQLRHENQRFDKAVRTFWIYVGVSVVTVIAAVMMLVGMASGDGGMAPAVITLVLAVVMLVMALRLQYHTYGGFEELREVRGIDYPPRRIMWCFYLGVISMVISLVSITSMVLMLVSGALQGGEEAVYALMGTIGLMSDVLLVVGVVIEAVHLWLMFTYMQAVRAAEENEARDRWDSLR